MTAVNRAALTNKENEMILEGNKPADEARAFETKKEMVLTNELDELKAKYDDVIDFVKENEMYESLQEWWSNNEN